MFWVTTATLVLCTFCGPGLPLEGTRWFQTILLSLSGSLSSNLQCCLLFSVTWTFFGMYGIESGAARSRSKKANLCAVLCTLFLLLTLSRSKFLKLLFNRISRTSWTRQLNSFFIFELQFFSALYFFWVRKQGDGLKWKKNWPQDFVTLCFVLKPPPMTSLVVETKPQLMTSRMLGASSVRRA